MPCRKPPPGWRARWWRWARLLGTALKLDGRLTIQTKGDGPLDLVTADYYGADENRHRGVRGYARLDASRFAVLADKDFAKLAGKGALAITIEPQAGGKTYQGIVELSPDGIGASAETYFAQSEQLAHRDQAGGRAALCRGRSSSRTGAPAASCCR